MSTLFSRTVGNLALYRRHDDDDRPAGAILSDLNQQAAHRTESRPADTAPQTPSPRAGNEDRFSTIPEEHRTFWAHYQALREREKRDPEAASNSLSARFFQAYKQAGKAAQKEGQLFDTTTTDASAEQLTIESVAKQMAQEVLRLDFVKRHDATGSYARKAQNDAATGAARQEQIKAERLASPAWQKYEAAIAPRRLAVEQAAEKERLAAQQAAAERLKLVKQWNLSGKAQQFEAAQREAAAKKAAIEQATLEIRADITRRKIAARQNTSEIVLTPAEEQMVADQLAASRRIQAQIEARKQAQRAEEEAQRAEEQTQAALVAGALAPRETKTPATVPDHIAEQITLARIELRDNIPVLQPALSPPLELAPVAPPAELEPSFPAKPADTQPTERFAGLKKFLSRFSRQKKSDKNAIAAENAVQPEIPADADAPPETTHHKFSPRTGRIVAGGIAVASVVAIGGSALTDYFTHYSRFRQESAQNELELKRLHAELAQSRQLETRADQADQKLNALDNKITQATAEANRIAKLAAKHPYPFQALDESGKKLVAETLAARAKIQAEDPGLAAALASAQNVIESGAQVAGPITVVDGNHEYTIRPTASGLVASTSSLTWDIPGAKAHSRHNDMPAVMMAAATPAEKSARIAHNTAHKRHARATPVSLPQKNVSAPALTQATLPVVQNIETSYDCDVSVNVLTGDTTVRHVPYDVIPQGNVTIRLTTHFEGDNSNGKAETTVMQFDKGSIPAGTTLGDFLVQAASQDSLSPIEYAANAAITSHRQTVANENHGLTQSPLTASVEHPNQSMN